MTRLYHSSSITDTDPASESAHAYEEPSSSEADSIPDWTIQEADEDDEAQIPAPDSTPSAGPSDEEDTRTLPSLSQTPLDEEEWWPEPTPTPIELDDSQGQNPASQRIQNLQVTATPDLPIRNIRFTKRSLEKSNTAPTTPRDIDPNDPYIGSSHSQILESWRQLFAPSKHPVSEQAPETAAPPSSLQLRQERFTSIDQD